MNTITPFPLAHIGHQPDVVFLHCRSQLRIDPEPMRRIFRQKPLQEAEDAVCRMLGDIAAQLDLLQGSLAKAEFASMTRPAKRIALTADQLGLSDVAVAAQHLGVCMMRADGVATQAVMARLERGFDLAVSEIWTFRDL